jgi:fatty acid desaturase
MLRYRADRRPIGLLLLYAVLVAGQWMIVPTGGLGLTLVAATCFLAWVAAVIAHNIVHSPVFESRRLNRIFQVWVSLSYGFPISDYLPGHNLSHHRFTQLQEDLMRTTRVNFRWNLLNFLFFMPAVTPGVIRGNSRYVAAVGARAAAWRRPRRIETVAVWSVKALLLLLDWRKALLYVIVPHLFANWAIVSVNFIQHDGCDHEHPVNHSRNFVGRLFNWWAVNNGYHAIHHMHPGLHWSVLPAAHAAQVAPHNHPALNQRSMFGYIFKAAIYPGRRLRYDGVPVVVVDDGPDRDWIAANESSGPD